MVNKSKTTKIQQVVKMVKGIYHIGRNLLIQQAGDQIQAEIVDFMRQLSVRLEMAKIEQLLYCINGAYTTYIGMNLDQGSN